MTLGEMRQALIFNIFDRLQDFLPTPDANRILNMSAKHVANWADSLRQGLFLETATFTGTTGTAPYELVSFGVGGFAISSAKPFRRAVAVYRTNAASPTVMPLDLIGAEERFAHVLDTTSATPKVYVFNQSLGLVNGAASINLQLDYSAGLPDMTLDANTPGETAATGRANALPQDYHHLIVTYATFMALQAEASASATVWAEMYKEQRDALAAALPPRRKGAA